MSEITVNIGIRIECVDDISADQFKRFKEEVKELTYEFGDRFEKLMKEFSIKYSNQDGLFFDHLILHNDHDY